MTQSSGNARVFATLLAALCMAAGGAAHAQRVFKYVMPDGRVVYSDKTVPGGRLVDEVAPPPPADPQAVPPPRPETSPDQRNAVRERLADRNRLVQQATGDLEAANARLAAAQRQLAEGKEPLPGERTGTAGGGSRLNDAYWDRQAANEAAVARARAEVDAAQAELNRFR